MTPSHAVKKGKRYRYYVSQTLITGSRADAPKGRRIPAGEIEQLILERICQALIDQSFMLKTISAVADEPAVQKQFLEQARKVAQGWPDLATADLRAILLTFVIRIDVRADKVEIQLRPQQLTQTIRNDHELHPKGASDDELAETVTLSIPARFKRSGMESLMVIEGQRGKRPNQKPDRSLIRLLVNAMDFRDRIMKGHGNSIREIAEQAEVSPSYFTRVFRLAYLAPDIVQAILNGEHPPSLTAAKLTASSRLPLTWPQQRELLGFV